jgi:1,4-dihydroxy-2-naphthoate octaprenyltransferase
MKRQSLSLLIRLARPHFLLGAMLVYALGAGVTHYLGHTIRWDIYLFGQIWVTLIQLSTHFFNEYFDFQADQENANRTPFSGGSGALGPGKLPREVALWSGIICLTGAASFSVLLVSRSNNAMELSLVMLLIFLGAFLYSVPPVRLAASGYGELTTAVVVSNLVPAMAFILQYGELHRLLAMTTFPLTAINIAMMLAFELPDYATDLKHGKRTMMVRAGWERGMLLHNIMVVIGFLLLGTAIFFGLPISIALPGLLPLPLGLFQIWMMNRIASGAKPNWSILTFTAVAFYACVAYLLAFAFWTR